MEFIVFLIIGLIIFFVLWLLIWVPIMGIAYIAVGNIPLGGLCLMPAFCLIGVFLYLKFVVEPEDRRWTALSYKYNFPLHLGKDEAPVRWYKGFKTSIDSGLASMTDTNKQADLKHCLQIVEKMKKENSFEGLHRAFLLTGCHMEIKDSTGNSIAKIV